MKKNVIIVLSIILVISGCSKKESEKQVENNNEIQKNEEINIDKEPEKKSTYKEIEGCKFLSEKIYKGDEENYLNITFYEYLPLEYETKKADYEYNITSGQALIDLCESEDFKSKAAESTFSFIFNDDEEEMFVDDDTWKTKIFNYLNKIKIVDLNISGCKKLTQLNDVILNIPVENLILPEQVVSRDRDSSFDKIKNCISIPYTNPAEIYQFLGYKKIQLIIIII